MRNMNKSDTINCTGLNTVSNLNKEHNNHTDQIVMENLSINICQSHQR